MAIILIAFQELGLIFFLLQCYFELYVFLIVAIIEFDIKRFDVSKKINKSIHKIKWKTDEKQDAKS